jgi:hypothetical protein
MKRVFLAAAALFVLAGAPVLSPGRQLFYRDTARFDYPVWREIASRLSHAQLPLWNPWTEAGTSTLGQLTPGALHPFALLYLPLPFDLAFKLQHLLPLPLALIGAWLLARKLGASREAALAGGFAYGGCGFLISMAGSNLPYILGGATAPWALWGFARVLERPRASTLLTAAALLSLFAYAGEPLGLMIVSILGGCAALVRARLRGALLAAAWVTVAAALSAPALLPAALRISSSTRAHGLPAREVGRYELRPLRLAGLFVPFAFDDRQETVSRRDDVTVYEEFLSGSGEESSAFADTILIGPAALLFALFAAGERRGRALLGGAAILLLAACGQSLGVWAALAKVVPPLGFFRFPEKLVAPASLLLCMAAALGVDAALRKPRRLLAASLASGALLLALALLLPAAGALTGLGRIHSPAAAEAFRGSLRWGLSISGIVCAAVAAGARFAPFAPALLAAGALFVHRPFSAPVSIYGAGDQLAHELQAAAGPSPLHWRIYTDERSMYGAGADRRVAQFAGTAASLMPGLNLLAGVETASTYSAVFDAAYLRLATDAPAAFRRVFDVRFAILLPQDVRPSERGRVKKAPHGLFLREYGAHPAAWFAEKIAGARSDGEALQALRDGADVVSGEPPPAGAGEIIALRRERPEHFEAEVRVSSNALLVFSEHSDPGWTGSVDGQEVPLRAVDLAAMGLVVPAGEHRVELRFFPRGLLPGFLIALATLLVLAVAAARSKPICAPS